MVSTHSRAEAAAFLPKGFFTGISVSTHSRAEAAAELGKKADQATAFQHTAARRRLPFNKGFLINSPLFQHTAARRRLLPT